MSKCTCKATYFNFVTCSSARANSETLILSRILIFAQNQRTLSLSGALKIKSVFINPISYTCFRYIAFLISRRNHVLGAIRGKDFIWRTKDIGDRYNSYSLFFSVDLGISEGYTDVLLRIYRNSVYVTAVFDPPNGETFSIYLYESNFKYMDTNTTTVHQLRYILTNITQLEITTVYETNSKHYQKLKNFVQEKAVETSNRNFAKATNIELCSCPLGYEGHACGGCADGYGKSFTKLLDNSEVFECAKCSDLCNGNTDVCDAETGVCSDCANNTGKLFCLARG